MTEREKQLTEQVEQLTARVNELLQKLEAAEAKIAELTERLNKNSQNSSKPPSSDGYRKPSPKSLRQPTGRKQGGQPGHKGNTLKIVREPTETVPHMPDKCAGCPRMEECRRKGCVGQRRYVADAVVEISLTAHEAMEVL